MSLFCTNRIYWKIAPRVQFMLNFMWPNLLSSFAQTLARAYSYDVASQCLQFCRVILSFKVPNHCIDCICIQMYFEIWKYIYFLRRSLSVLSLVHINNKYANCVYAFLSNKRIWGLPIQIRQTNVRYEHIWNALRMQSESVRMHWTQYPGMYNEFSFQQHSGSYKRPLVWRGIRLDARTRALD